LQKRPAAQEIQKSNKTWQRPRPKLHPAHCGRF
jgi:hypothetical protein